jgi:hypothetical protein
VENLKKKDYLRVRGVDDRRRGYIKMDVSKVGGEDMDLIKLARYRGQQLVLVKSIINVCVPQKTFLVAE